MATIKSMYPGFTPEECAAVIGVRMDNGSAGAGEARWMDEYKKEFIEPIGVKTAEDAAKMPDEVAETKLAEKHGWARRTATAVWEAIKSFFAYIGKMMRNGWKRAFGKKDAAVNGNGAGAAKTETGKAEKVTVEEVDEVDGNGQKTGGKVKATIVDIKAA